MNGDANIRVAAGIAPAALLSLAAALLGGCLQTAPHGGTPHQVRAAGLLYSCSNGSTLRVTRAQGSASALIQVDGQSYHLPRDAAVTGAEHYTSHLQTLSLQGNTATFEGVGLPRYGLCTTNSAPDLLEAPQRRRGSQD